METKLCSVCIEALPVTRFLLGHGKCRECYNTHRKSSRAADPSAKERQKQHAATSFQKHKKARLHKDWVAKLMRLYGLSEADYNRTLHAQGDKCALCKTEKPRGRGRWHVDHNHATGEVRGILCMPCNVKIGALEKLRTQVGREALEGYLIAVVSRDVSRAA